MSCKEIHMILIMKTLRKQGVKEYRGVEMSYFIGDKGGLEQFESHGYKTLYVIIMGVCYMTSPARVSKEPEDDFYRATQPRIEEYVRTGELK